MRVRISELFEVTVFVHSDQKRQLLLAPCYEQNIDLSMTKDFCVG